MSIMELLLAGGGALVGILVTFFSYSAILRSKKRHAAGLIEAAEREARQIAARTKDDADKARAAAVVEGKMEALKLREDGTYDVLYRKWFQRSEAK